YQYNIKQTSDEKTEKYQLGDYILIQHQILQTNMTRTAPCCKKYYNCRLCHNDKESHELDRKTVEAIKCLQCDSSQEICRLFDDTEKGQFHCSGCGICRVGGKENFFHCDRCDMCLGIQLKDSHK
ncbi:hypothetical protein pdam_00024270, partial [Pocillopora damicornis]